MSIVARILHLLLLGGWIGGGAFYLLFERTVFDVVASKHTASDVMIAALGRFELFGLLAGPLLLLTLGLGWLSLQVPLRARAVMVLVMVGLQSLSRYWVSPQIVQVKAAMGRKLEDMSSLDPLVAEYSQLQNWSAWLMFAHLLIALVLLVFAVVARPKRKFGGIEL